MLSVSLKNRIVNKQNKLAFLILSMTICLGKIATLFLLGSMNQVKTIKKMDVKEDVFVHNRTSEEQSRILTGDLHKCDAMSCSMR